MTIKRKLVAMTTEETSPGVPYWGPNQVITIARPDETDVALENLVAGRRYYVRVWTEDHFGNASPEVLRVIDVPPDATVPETPSDLTLSAIAFGFKATWSPVADTDLSEYELAYALDDGTLTGPGSDADYTVVKSKTTHQTIEGTVGQMYWARVRSVDFSGNQSPWTDLAEVTPFQRADLVFGGPGFFDSGSSCSVYVKVPSNITTIESVIVSLAFREFQAMATAAASGGSSTSGASSASTSDNTALSVAVADVTDHFHVHNETGTTTGFGDGDDVTVITDIDPHHHTMPHTHSTPAHAHSLTYGTYEETFPVSHSVTLKTYKRTAGAWVLQDTISGITDDLDDEDLTDVITGPGDWKLTIISAAAQPQGGRLGVDVFGSIIAIMGGPDIFGAITVPGATYVAGQLWVGGVEVFDETGALLVGAAPTGAAGGDLSGTYPNPSVTNDSHSHTGATLPAYDASGAAAAAQAASQPLDADLTAIAALSSAADKVPYSTGVGAWALAAFTSVARTLVAATTAAAQRIALGLQIGVDVQAYDAELAAIAGLTSASDKLPYFTGAGTASVTTFTAAGRALVDDADAAAQRTTLGLGAAALESATTALRAVDFLVGTASSETSAEIAVGTTPGGELGGTWSSPTVDATHSGSAHHSQSHGASDHTNITRSLFLPAEDAKLDGSALAVGGTAPDAVQGIALADAATQGAYWTFMVPADWDSGVITVQPVWWAGSTDANATHTVRWSMDALERTEGDSVAAGGGTTAFTGVAKARTANSIYFDTATSTGRTPSAANTLFRVNVRRVGADAADTYVGIVNLIGLIVTYTANQ